MKTLTALTDHKALPEATTHCSTTARLGPVCGTTSPTVCACCLADRMSFMFGREEPDGFHFGTGASKPDLSWSGLGEALATGIELV